MFCRIISFFAAALVSILASGQSRVSDHLEAAARFADQDQLNRAFAEVQAALVQSPKDERAHYQLGVLLGQAGETRAAEEQFRRAIQLKPDYSEAHYRLALTQIARPVDKLDWTQAAAECRAALESRPDYPEALNLLGAALVSLNDVAHAIALFEHAIRLRPEYADAHFNLGMALEQTGQADAAIREYYRAVASRPAYAEVHSRLGKCLLGAGKREEARQELMLALRINPDLPDAHYALARLYRAIDGGPKAQLELSQVAELESRRRLAAEATHLSNVGLDLAAKGDFAGAVKSLQAAVKAKPDYAIAHYNLGLVLADNGDLNQAIAQLRVAISLNPVAAKGHLNLGRLLERSGDLKGAEKEMHQAVNLQPSDEVACSELHVLRAQMPASEFREDPPMADTPQRHNEAGRTLNARGDSLGSVAEFLKALAMKPDYFEARYNLAVAYLQTGDLPKSALEFRKLLLLRPNDVDSHFGLGLVLRQDGDWLGAADEFKAVLAERPGYPSAKYYLEITQQRPH
jgi:tetratricopeptide (TPR) repeat protein